jgi:hypothetical protein
MNGDEHNNKKVIRIRNTLICFLLSVLAWQLIFLECDFIFVAHRS